MNDKISVIQVFYVFFSSSFQDIRSLHSLTLSGNWLSVENIEVLVSKMPNLQELNIDETGIATLPPGLFYNNLKLKELNISANYLIHLDASGSDFLKKKFSCSLKSSTHERNSPSQSAPTILVLKNWVGLRT